jgi:hypothetical protein
VYLLGDIELQNFVLGGSHGSGARKLGKMYKSYGVRKLQNVVAEFSYAVRLAEKNVLELSHAVGFADKSVLLISYGVGLADMLWGRFPSAGDWAEKLWGRFPSVRNRENNWRANPRKAKEMPLLYKLSL